VKLLLGPNCMRYGETISYYYTCQVWMIKHYICTGTDTRFYWALRHKSNMLIYVTRLSKPISSVNLLVLGMTRNCCLRN